jgi:hypothetical protein
MKKYTALKKEKQTKFDTLLKDCKVFFAFSNEQFETNKTELKEGEKYISIGAGGYMPKSYIQTYLDGSKDIEKWYKKSIKEGKQQDAEILYELNNHECFYTGSIDDILYLPYTREQIMKVYNENYHKYLELNG